MMVAGCSHCIILVITLTAHLPLHLRRPNGGPNYSRCVIDVRRPNNEMTVCLVFKALTLCARDVGLKLLLLVIAKANSLHYT